MQGNGEGAVFCVKPLLKGLQKDKSFRNGVLLHGRVSALKKPPGAVLRQNKKEEIQQGN